MLDLNITTSNSQPLRLLCLGAHCDDIEIGCGGTILKFIAAGPQIAVHWVVFSSTPDREKEAQSSAAAFLTGVQEKTIVIHAFRDGYLPYQGEEVKNCFEKIKREVSPDLILTHYRHDLHQDHRIVSEMTWNTFRNHLILEYEIPKYDGDLGSPNVFVPLDDATCLRKINYILGIFHSQHGKQWFSREVFSSILRLRGMEANAASGYAEAFYCRKAILGMEIR